MPPRRSARQAATSSQSSSQSSSSSSSSVPTASLQQTQHDLKRTRSNRDEIETNDEGHMSPVAKRGRSKLAHKSVKPRSVGIEHEDQHDDVKLSAKSDDEKSIEQSHERPHIEPHTDTDSDTKFDVNETSNEPDQQPAITSQVESMTSKVFDYSFIVQLMLEHMTDRDVLVNLIIASRAVNRCVVRYEVKCQLRDKRAVDRITQAAATFNDIPRTSSFTVPINQRIVIKWVSISDIADDTLSTFKSWLPVTVTKLLLFNSRSFEGTLTPSDIPSHITDLTVYGWRTIMPGMLHEGIKSLRTNLVLCNGSLPSSLEHLEIDLRIPRPAMGQDMISHLPSQLTELAITGTLLDIMRIGIIPASVKDMELYIYDDETALPVGFFPVGLERLKVWTNRVDAYGLFVSSSQSTDQARRSYIIPDTVTELLFHGPFNNNCYELQAEDLPPSLRVLDFGDYGRQLHPGVLPSTLRELTLRGSNGNQPLEPGAIPDGVTYLKLFSDKLPDHKFQPIMPGVIPNSVVTLEWGYEPTKKSLIVGCIPPSVKVLIFGHDFAEFTRDLPAGFIPHTVRSLTFGDSTKQSLSKTGVIPSGVKYLRFGREFSNGGKPVRAGVIPDTVTHLYFGRNSAFAKQSMSIPSSVIALGYL